MKLNHSITRNLQVISEFFYLRDVTKVQTMDRLIMHWRWRKEDEQYQKIRLKDRPIEEQMIHRRGQRRQLEKKKLIRVLSTFRFSRECVSIFLFSFFPSIDSMAMDHIQVIVKFLPLNNQLIFLEKWKIMSTTWSRTLSSLDLFDRLSF